MSSITLCNYSQHPFFRIPAEQKNLFELRNLRIIGWVSKGNYRKRIKIRSNYRTFELWDIALTDVDCNFLPLIKSI